MSNTRVIKQDVRRQEQIRRKKTLRRRRLQRRRNIAIVLFFVGVLVIGANGVMQSGNDMHNGKENVNITSKDKSNGKKNKVDGDKKDEKILMNGENSASLEVVDSPKERKLSEILTVLESMSQDDERVADIYENYEIYPEELLGLLVNNPETIDFVSGYPDRNQSEKNKSDERQQYEQFPLFMQWDLRWGYEEYGDSIIGLAGCGPTCLSMVVSSLTYNYDVTPDVVARYSEQNGHYVKGTGTSWSLMTEGAREYGVKVKEIVLDENAIKEDLDNGKIIIAAVGSGSFTTKGHFIVIYSYDEEGFYVNDPNCKYRSSVSWSYEELSKQIKMLWSYWING